jgi:hypothetical protein
MGYEFVKDATKADIVKEVLSGGGTPQEFFPLVHRVVGGCLWVVWEHKSTDRSARFIGLYLLESRLGFGWGYKALEESMGPSKVNCPLQFLEIVPIADSPYAEAWRNKVREYHARVSGESTKTGRSFDVMGLKVDEVL